MLAMKHTLLRASCIVTALVLLAASAAVADDDIRTERVRLEVGITNAGQNSPAAESGTERKGPDS
jgi:uncharacterized membrane protein